MIKVEWTQQSREGRPQTREEQKKEEERTQETRRGSKKRMNIKIGYREVYKDRWKERYNFQTIWKRIICRRKYFFYTHFHIYILDTKEKKRNLTREEEQC